MTFSIVARDGAHWGVAVASKFLAAGAVVPAARAGVGAIATQSFVNLRYLPDGLALLEQGRSAQQVVDALVGDDELRAERQVGVVDRDGGAAAFTGDGCIDWAGSAAGEGYTVQGNCLAGPQVVQAVLDAYAEQHRLPLAQRLVTALQAGDAAGGDRRGRQSAAVLVVTPGGGYGGGSDVQVDLRVDDAAEPLPELQRLLALHALYFGRPRPEDLRPLDGGLAEEVDSLLRAAGHDGGAPLEQRLSAWMGWENYEERDVPGAIDPVVLDRLREAGRAGR